MRVSIRVLLAPLLVLPLLVVGASPALADSHPPQLLSAERTSPAQVGGGSPLTIAWTASDQDETGSGVSSVQFVYEDRDGSGGLIAWPTASGGFAPGPDGRSVAGAVLTPWAASGHYVLESFTVWDRAGNTTTYGRDGSVTSYPTGVTAPPPSGVDFSALDFDVSNPLSDSAAPTIRDLAPISRTVHAGEPVVLTSHPADDRAGLARIQVRYRSPSGVTEVNTAADVGLAPAGLTSAVLPLGAEGGTWQATLVQVEDLAGNGVIYPREGTAPQFRPSGVRTFEAQPAIDFAALDITVTPGAPDADAPTLTDVTREGPGVLHRADDIVMDYVPHDASALRFIDFYFVDSTGHNLTVMNQCLPERGYAVDQVPLGFDPGPVRLQQISVVDALFNVRQYRRDGSVWTQGRSQPDAEPGIDLSRFDFTVQDGDPSYTGHPHTRFGCPATAKLPVTIPDTAASGQAIDVSGQVLTGSDAPLANAAVGLFAEPEGGTPQLVTVLTTDANGRYAASTVVDRTTTYRVRFLGRDGAAGAEATTSAPYLVKVGGDSTQPSPGPTPTSSGPSAGTAGSGPAPTASPAGTAAPQPSGAPAPGPDVVPSLALSSTVITAGQRVTVTYRGAPGQTIDILSKTQPAYTYRRIGSVTLDSSGVASTTHAPNRNTRIMARTAGGLTSAQPLIQVRSVASLNVHRVRPRTYTFSGTVSPAVYQRLVNVYRNGVLVAQGRTNASGVYVITATLAAGTFDFRARTGNDAYNLPAASRTIRAVVY